MKILIEIGHPAHVHYFKNVIKQLESKGHSVIVVAREKEFSQKLLKAYGISFISRGKGRSSMIGKFFYLLKASYIVAKHARKNKIDLYLSFGSPYGPIASLLYKKPVIVLDDTEHDPLRHAIISRLATWIVTPEYFLKEFGTKHIRFRATMESAYLHDKYFTDEKLHFEDSGTNASKDKNVLLRFVSWQASHDANQEGFSDSEIKQLINELSKVYNIHISSEKELPDELNKFAINIAPDKIHHYIKNMDLFIGDSGTMATESAYLGVETIQFDPGVDSWGVIDFFSNLDTLYIARNFNDVIKKTKEIISLKDSQRKIETGLKKIKDAEISLVDFIVWFVENPTESAKIMKENPDYQNRFK